MTVQRYNASYNDYFEAEDGEFVAYDDYEKLVELIDTFFSCADWSIDDSQILCADPRDALSKILGYRV